MPRIVKIGTETYKNAEAAEPGFVLATVPFPANPIWDDVLQNVREKNSDELLEEAISNKRAELKAEGLRRMQAINSAVASFDAYEMLEAQFLSLWNSLAPAAKGTISLDPMIQAIKNVYDTGKAAYISIGSLDKAGVDAYDVTTAPGWPE